MAKKTQLTLPRSYIDHLYDYVELDEAIYTLVQKDDIAAEMARLQEISQLGIISDIYTLARHNKLEHCIGLYHLVCKCTEKGKEKLPGTNINWDALKAAALLHGIGHYALSYPVEWGVLMVMKLDRRRAQFILKRVRELQQSVCSAYEDCEEKCFDRIVQDQKVGELVRWLSAAKIRRFSNNWPRRLWRLFKPPEILRYLVCKRTAGYDLLWKLDQMDYAQRDIHYLGNATVRINLPYMADQLRKELADGRVGVSFGEEWSIIEALCSYLDDEIYHDPDVLVVESMLARALAKAILDGKLTVREMVDWTDKNAFAFYSVLALGVYQGISELLESARAKRFRLLAEQEWVPVPEGKAGSWEMEEFLSGHRGKELVGYPFQEDYLVGIQRADDEFDLHNVFLICHSGTRRPAEVLQGLARLQKAADLQYPDFREGLCKWVFDREIRIRWDRYVESVRGEIERLKARKRKPIRILNAFFDENGYPWSLESAVWGGSESFSDEEWIRRLCKEFVMNPFRFKPQVRERISDSLDPGEETGRELSEYLKEVFSSGDGSTLRWVIPSLELIGEHGETETELDLVTVEVGSNTSAGIVLKEVTTSSSSTKEDEDKAKLRRWGRYLGKRFGGSIDVKLFFNDDRIGLRGRPPGPRPLGRP